MHLQFNTRLYCLLSSSDSSCTEQVGKIKGNRSGIAASGIQVNYLRHPDRIFPVETRIFFGNRCYCDNSVRPENDLHLTHIRTPAWSAPLELSRGPDSRWLIARRNGKRQKEAEDDLWIRGRDRGCGGLYFYGRFFGWPWIWTCKKCP